jgi:hypothetical protein
MQSLLRFGAGSRIYIGITLSADGIAFVTARMLQGLKAMKSPEGCDDLRKVSGSPLYRRAPAIGVKVRLREAYH